VIQQPITSDGPRISVREALMGLLGRAQSALAAYHLRRGLVRSLLGWLGRLKALYAQWASYDSTGVAFQALSGVHHVAQLMHTESWPADGPGVVGG